MIVLYCYFPQFQCFKTRMLTLLIKFIQFSLLLFCGTGTRAGGGMGENMATPDLWISTPVGDNGDWIVDPLWVLRSGYDFFFFLIIIIIIMNILFGIIIDTFSDLRTQRDEKTTNKETTVAIKINIVINLYFLFLAGRSTK